MNELPRLSYCHLVDLSPFSLSFFQEVSSALHADLGMLCLLNPLYGPAFAAAMPGAAFKGCLCLFILIFCFFQTSADFCACTRSHSQLWRQHPLLPSRIYMPQAAAGTASRQDSIPLPFPSSSLSASWLMPQAGQEDNSLKTCLSLFQLLLSPKAPTSSKLSLTKLFHSSQPCLMLNFMSFFHWKSVVRQLCASACSAYLA